MSTQYSCDKIDLFAKKCPYYDCGSPIVTVLMLLVVRARFCVLHHLVLLCIFVVVALVQMKYETTASVLAGIVSKVSEVLDLVFCRNFD